MILLKQSTTATLRLGPFVDATDAVTPEILVTLGAADQAEILKATGATVDIAAATFAAITGADGWYDLSLTTAHTDTLGMLTIIVQDASVCLPVFARAMVIPALVYDSLVAGTDALQVDAIQISGDAIAADNLELEFDGTGYRNAGIKKNAAFSDFMFLMVDSTDHVTAETGLTVTGQRSLNAAAFEAVGGTIAEVGNGIYQFDALAADTNGDVVTWRFSSAGADDAFFTFKTTTT